ncbi:hypothetical protein [Microbulbifer sp. PSTR4-B]|uniref:hypothetical protein n=1 Tax=Microbulbifer sp. PSTR4-B TaxID=3243396 RepID=UPI0040395226
MLLTCLEGELTAAPCTNVHTGSTNTGRADRAPTTDLAGALTATKKKHLTAITDPAEVGHPLTAIDEYQGSPVVRAALKLSPSPILPPWRIAKT